MRKISDVVREKVDCINNTEHFEVDMKIIDSKVNDKLRISFEVIELRLPENITMELTIAGKDTDGKVYIITPKHIFVNFKEDSETIGKINILDSYNLKNDIKFSSENFYWKCDFSEAILDAIKEIPIYKS
ncbi:hypothetical protein ACSXCW_02765 [Clostridium perfringens]|nr:hypothetical protein [Clostridium perfringens]